MELQRVEFDGGIGATLDCFFHGLGGNVNEPLDVLVSFREIPGTFYASELWDLYETHGIERIVTMLDDLWLEQQREQGVAPGRRLDV